MTGFSLSVCAAATMHIGLSGDFNERHWCIQGQYDHVIAGAFKNSEGNTSTYLGLRAEREFTDGVTGFIEGGAATGYSFATVVPYGRIGVELGDHVDVFAIPAINSDTREIGAAVGVAVKVPLFRGD